MNIRPINVAEKFDSFSDYWNPKIIANLNGQQVKVAKVKGEFVRHVHELEDELFWVIDGELEMVFDDKTITLKAGEMLVVPKGVYHKPVANEEVKLILFEPASTFNTGNIINELSQKNLEDLS